MDIVIWDPKKTAGNPAEYPANETDRIPDLKNPDFRPAGDIWYKLIFKCRIFIHIFLQIS